MPRPLVARAAFRSFVISVILAQNACVFVAAGAGVGGMAGASTAGTPDVAVDTRVAVRFRPLRDLAVTGLPRREDTTFTKVVAVFGKIQHMRGDTMWVVASEVQASGRRLTFDRSGPPVAVVVRGEGTSVRRLTNQADSALIGALKGGLIVAAVAWATLMVLMSGMTT